MKFYNYKFLLFLFALLLIGTNLFVYADSEVNPEQSSDATGNQKTNTDQNSENGPPKEQNSLEQRSNILKNVNNEMVKLRGEIENLKAESSNPTLLYILIVGLAVFTVSAVLIFLGLRLRRKLHTEVESIRNTFRNSLNQNKQSFDSRLNFLSQRDEEKTKRIDEIESKHSGFKNMLSQFENRTDTLMLTFENMKISNVPNDQKHEIPQVEVQPPVEEIIQKAHAKVKTLTQAYETGEPFFYVDIENLTQSQNVLLDLNWLARSIDDWKNDLDESGTANQELIQTLGYANQVVKGKLRDIRKQTPTPLPIPLNLDDDAIADTAINESKDYVSKYEGLLNGYQLQLKIDVKEYDHFIPQLIKERLFMGVVRNISSDQIPKQLVELLDFVGYEVVPIEIGKTVADSLLHDIQGSERTGVKSGTIAKVILPGLQRKDNGEIIQQPSVIRAE